MRKDLAAASNTVEGNKGRQYDLTAANRENRINAHNAVNDLLIAGLSHSSSTAAAQQFRI